MSVAESPHESKILHSDLDSVYILLFFPSILTLDANGFSVDFSIIHWCLQIFDQLSILCRERPFSGSYVHGKKNVINKFRGASADSEKFHTNIKQNLTPVMGKVYVAPDFSSFLVPLVRCQKRR